MLVSVILPVYNNEGTVLQTVDSVLNQSHEGLQLIIVNDGSTDRSVDLIKSIQDERVIVINQGNKGVSAARNLGFQQATGEYIAFIDADDVWLKTKLEEELEVVFRQSEPVALVYSGYYCVDDKFRVIKRSPDYSV